jgi:hypothetical protein
MAKFRAAVVQDAKAKRREVSTYPLLNPRNPSHSEDHGPRDALMHRGPLFWVAAPSALIVRSDRVCRLQIGSNMPASAPFARWPGSARFPLAGTDQQITVLRWAPANSRFRY